MNFSDDLEYREERNELAKQQTPVKKQITLKLKSSSNLNNNSSVPNQNHNDNLTSITNNNFQSVVSNTIPLEASLEPPHNSIKKNHPISNLNWNMNVNTISQKIVDQTMDYCMICYLPILIYGRLIPCKHVMCIQCANNLDLKMCLKESCHENIERIEKALRGSIFVCNYDQDNTNIKNVESFRMQPDISQKKQCGRSYMSQRDLIAHVKHRHDPNIPIKINSDH